MRAVGAVLPGHLLQARSRQTESLVLDYSWDAACTASLAIADAVPLRLCAAKPGACAAPGFEASDDWAPCFQQPLLQDQPGISRLDASSAAFRQTTCRACTRCQRRQESLRQQSATGFRVMVSCILSDAVRCLSAPAGERPATCCLLATGAASQAGCDHLAHIVLRPASMRMQLPMPHTAPRSIPLPSVLKSLPVRFHHHAHPLQKLRCCTIRANQLAVMPQHLGRVLHTAPRCSAGSKGQRFQQVSDAVQLPGEIEFQWHGLVMKFTSPSRLACRDAAPPCTCALRQLPASQICSPGKGPPSGACAAARSARCSTSRCARVGPTAG